MAESRAFRAAQYNKHDERAVLHHIQKGKNRDAVRAVLRGDVDGLRDALARGADPNHSLPRDGFWYTGSHSLLEKAATLGNADCCALLVAAGADVNLAVDNRPEAESYGVEHMPLHPACELGHVAVVSLLVAAGADVDCRDADGETPLHKACSSGQDRRYIDRINIFRRVRGREVAMPLPPLHLQRRHAAIVSLLLAAGADVDLRPEDGGTPLHNACLDGHTEIVQLLLATGTTNLRDRNTSLRAALDGGNRDCALALLRAGAELQVLPPSVIAGVERFIEKAEAPNSSSADSDEPIVRVKKPLPKPTIKSRVKKRVKERLRNRSRVTYRVKRLNDFLIRIRDAGGWDAHVRRHRALLVGRLRNLLRLPDDALGLIVDFSAPQGGN